MAFTYGNLGYAKDSNGNVISYNSNPVYQIRLGYQVNSQDIENNRSNISLQLEVRSVNSSYKTYGYNQTSIIDGTTLSAKSFDFRSTNTWQIFGTRTFDVTHNADGTYSVEKSGSFTTTATGTGRPHSGSASVQVTLPTIPRASSITVNDANIGSSTNIVINKASSSFTTTLSYKASGQSSWTTIVNKTSNQVYGWTVPTSFYSLIPNAKTISCEFKAETFSGNTSVGTKTTTATFTATGSPVINSSNATDVNSVTANLTEGTSTSSKMVRYASNVQISVNVSGQNSATISSVTVNGSSVSLSGTNPKTGSITFNGATTNTFTIVATDTRGYQTTTTKTMTMVNYVPLTINQNIKRNQPTDEKVNVSLSGNYFNASFGSQSNTLTVQYRYKESGLSTWIQDWTTVSNTKSGNTYTASTQLSGMTYTKSYNFEVRATDKVGTKTITGITVTKGEPVYWWDENGFHTIQKLYYGENGREDFAEAGFTYDKYGNMIHKRNTAGDLWSMKNYSGTVKYSIKPESGDVSASGLMTANDINWTPARKEGANANDLSGSSIYYVKDGTNLPSNWSYILTMRNASSTGDRGQLALGVTTKNLYTRIANSGSWTNWEQIAKISDVASSSSGTNGICIKFPSIKYQICFVKKTFQTSSSTTQIGTSGNVYYKTESWTFPSSFASAPYVVATSLDRAGGVYGATVEEPTTSAVNITAYGPASGRDTGYMAIAIGTYS